MLVFNSVAFIGIWGLEGYLGLVIEVLLEDMKMWVWYGCMEGEGGIKRRIVWVKDGRGWGVLFWEWMCYVLGIRESVWIIYLMCIFWVRYWFLVELFID